MPPAALRTPEERFSNLPDFAYEPKYVEDLPGYEGLRVAFIDEGSGERQTFLCLHGQPTWSFLYRKMIPVFREAGARVVAPDLLGFGRSDKPMDEAVYGFHFHREMLLALTRRLDLRDVTLVVQDWGGLLGLTLPVDADFAGRLSRVLMMNTAIATGEGAGRGFFAWRDFVRATPDLPVGALMKQAAPTLSEEEAAAYDAPFPDVRHKAGVRAFPERVMVSPDMEGVAESKAAARFWAETWSGPSFLAWGGADPVFTLEACERLKRQVRGCPEPFVLPQVGHFAQESGDVIAREALMRWSGR